MSTNFTFNPLESHVTCNLYSYYAMFRELEPVCWDAGLAAWICTDHGTCTYVLKNPDLFTADPRRLGVELPDVLNTLQTMDPPEHTPLRKLMVSAFQAFDLGGFEKRFRSLARQRVSDLSTDRIVDLTTELSEPLALEAIAEYIGTPVPDLPWFTEVSERLVRGMDGGYLPDVVPDAMKARAELSALAADWLRQEGQQGLVGFLARNRRAVKIAEGVVENTLRAVFHAGYSSSSRLLENVILLCLQNPDVNSTVREIAGTDAMRIAIEEIIRFESPVQAESRMCVTDTTLRGREIRKGDVVTLIIGAANHDPAVFVQPERIMLNRKPNSHLGFGRGIHSCLGAGLALLEARVLIEELLQQFPHVSLAGEPVRRVSGTFRGVASIPVMLHPTLAAARK